LVHVIRALKKAWVPAFAGMSGVLLLIGLPAARAEPEQDLERQAAMTQRFDPFDKGGGPDWEAAFPTPFLRQVASGKPEGVSLPLKRGSYMIVVLCNCGSMQVSLLDQSGANIAPLKVSDQAAMYSLDVAADGPYLAGIDMGECDEKACDFGVKVYRKKP
jgi:hypothetical protein